MDRWQWLGQPVEEWPRWLIFKNYASDAEKIIIHTLLDGAVVVRLGDWIVNNAQNDVAVERAAG